MLQTTSGLEGRQSPTAEPQSAFKIGKNKDFPAGTVQLRLTAAPPDVPAK